MTGRLDRLRVASWVGLFLLLGLGNYAGNLSGGNDRAGDALYTYTFAVGGVVLFSILLGLVLLIARGLPPREVFGLRRPRNTWAAAGGAAGVVVATLVVAAVLSPFIQPGDEQGLLPTEWDRSRLVPFVINGILVTLFVPVVEELSFRGLGVSLLAPLGEAWTVVLIGLLFAFAHGLFEAFPIFTAFGGALAWLRLRTDSVFPCIGAHALFNTIAIVGAAIEAANPGG